MSDWVVIDIFKGIGVANFKMQAGYTKSLAPSNSPAGTILPQAYVSGLEVFGAIQFPSWYNLPRPRKVTEKVFGAIQFLSWYNCKAHI